MGITEKLLNVEFSSETESKTRIIAGITLRGPLKLLKTDYVENKRENGEQEEEEGCSTTPTAEEAKIPTVLTCPAAPRKRKSAARCCHDGGVRDFFKVPDLDTVFIRRVEKESVRNGIAITALISYCCVWLHCGIIKFIPAE